MRGSSLTWCSWSGAYESGNWKRKWSVIQEDKSGGSMLIKNQITIMTPNLAFTRLCSPSTGRRIELLADLLLPDYIARLKYLFQSSSVYQSAQQCLLARTPKWWRVVCLVDLLPGWKTSLWRAERIWPNSMWYDERAAVDGANGERWFINGISRI